MSEPNEIILQIDRLLRLLPEGDFWKRIRIAISREEHEALRDFVFQYESSMKCEPRYFSRIRGVPVQVEQNPTAPELTVEFLHAKS